jgi:tetratricopeptide (TPR) repeat protein
VRTTWGGLAIVLVAWGPAAFAASGTQSEARRYLRSAAAFYDALDFDRALEQAKKAESHSKSADEDLEIALVEGILLANLDREDEADAAFRRGLSLQPDAKLPYKGSPKIVEQFERVRAQVKKSLAREAPVLEPATPPEPPPTVGAPPPAVVVTPAPAPSGGVRRYAWIPAVGGAVLAGGAAFAFSQSESKYSQLTTPQTPPVSQATASQDHSQGPVLQTTGWVLACAGGAALLTAAGMAIFGGPSATVAVVPGPGGAALAGTFP